MKRRSLLALGGLLGITGCGAGISWIIQNAPSIQAGLTDIQNIFDDVREWVDAFLLAHPNTPPSVKQAVDDTDAAIDALAQLLGAGVNASQGDIQAAEQKLIAAWNAMMAILGPLGVSMAKASTKSVHMPDGGLVVRVPLLVSKGALP